MSCHGKKLSYLESILGRNAISISSHWILCCSKKHTRMIFCCIMSSSNNFVLQKASHTAKIIIFIINLSCNIYLIYQETNIDWIKFTFSKWFSMLVITMNSSQWLSFTIRRFLLMGKYINYCVLHDCSTNYFSTSIDCILVRYMYPFID